MGFERVLRDIEKILFLNNYKGCYSYEYFYMYLNKARIKCLSPFIFNFQFVVMIQIHSSPPFQLLYKFIILYIQVEHHYFLCVHLIRKVPRGIAGAVTPVSFSKMTCINRIECKVALLISVVGIIFSCMR